MKTKILGVGNEMMGDDRAGLYAAHLLSNHNLPPNTVVECTSSIGLNLLDLLEDCQRAFIIDSMVDSSLSPGTVMRFTASELDNRQKNQYLHHNLGLADTLAFGAQNGLEMPPEIIIYAICAQDISTFGEELSPLVEKGAKKAVLLILQEITA